VAAQQVTVIGREKTGLGARYETVAERLLKFRKAGRIRTFSILPKLVRFENQEQRERIILLLRQHWVTQIHWIAGAPLSLLIPLIFNWVPILDFLPPNYQFMALIGWYLLVIAYIYEQFISWYYQVFIITDERIIDINFSNLTYKELSEAKIDNIEDVTYRQGGVLRAAFNFGDVVMQTAGAERQFMIESVPEPNRVVKIINELKLEEEHEKMTGRAR
ncbi:MAG: hypothetical protein U0946_07625, partial [Patescibacteria group bacterium]|nr:hypothetical protein [Patescibacteria group bacterium]